MPRQSDSTENKPGEKAMMRKFAVTACALSFAALGCGSDSGTTADTSVKPDVSVLKDGAADTYVPIDATVPDAPVQPDAAKPEVEGEV